MLTSATLSRRVRPRVECLEDRTCPSGIVFMNMSAAVTSGTNVQVSGHVLDYNGAPVQVTFSGVMSGTINPDASGDFSYTAPASALGTIFANAVDGVGGSGSSQTGVNWAPPSIGGLSVSYGSGHTVTISGFVDAQTPGGLTVNLSGVVNGTTVTNPNGSFSFTGTASALGSVQVSTTDVWGRATAPAQVTVANNAPTFTWFYTFHSYSNVWVFEGTVRDEHAEGLTVQLGGLPTLQGVTTTLDDHGGFYAMVQLQPGETGTVTANLTDWWGAASGTAYAAVC